MLDPIQAAVQKAGTITSIPTPPIPPVTLTDIKAKVPVVPDPNLVKRQLEAEAQLKVTEAKESKPWPHSTKTNSSGCFTMNTTSTEKGKTNLATWYQIWDY